MYASSAESLELTFDILGKLIMNALGMYDYQTNRLWSQFLSLAVGDPLAAARLELQPAPQTTRKRWQKLHPTLPVLEFRRFALDPYGSYYEFGSTRILGQTTRAGWTDRKE